MLGLKCDLQKKALKGENRERKQKLAKELINVGKRHDYD